MWCLNWIYTDALIIASNILKYQEKLINIEANFIYVQ